MNSEFLEKILDLFENCQFRGKSLQINVDEDLIKVLPLPRKLILDILSDSSIPNFLRLSNDQNTLYFQNNLRLCSIDQNESGSCHSSLCNHLHICSNYLLNNNNKCSQLKSCSHSHSLATNHNEYILQKMNLSSKDVQTRQLISRIIKLSSTNSSKLIVQSINGENISDHLIDQWLDQHKSLLKDQKFVNSKTVELIFDDDEVASMMEHFLIQQHSKSLSILKDFSFDLAENDLDKEVQFTNEQTNYLSLGRGRGRSQMNNLPLLNNQNTFSRRLASTTTNNQKKFTFSQRLSSTTNEHSPLPIQTKSPELRNFSKSEEQQTNSSPLTTNSKPQFVLRGYPTKSKEKSSNEILRTYIYTKPFIDEHICYLLGPRREQIIEKDQCEILSCLPSNYCRVKTNEQGKYIEKELYSILPETLNIELIQIPNHLSLIICSSAAENIFQQNQMHYAIISEPEIISLNIEVIQPPPSRQSNSFDDENSQQSSSDGKFHIKKTDSSIDVICGDICQTQVDIMICISTSNTLRDNVLRRAGTKIETQYKERHRPNDALLLDGGSTAAKKILFVPWQTEIEQTETTKTQKSLSDLVKWCIDQAYQRKAKSISFPPIGTGQLGLDPGFVCEAMISAASQCLHEYTIDVTFVIYSSNGLNDEDECYQVFRIYLDSLCEQIKSNKVSTPRTSNERKIAKMKNESIRRDIQSKRLLSLSDSSKVIKDYNLLIKSLEDLIYEKTFDLSLIERSLLDQIDLLIDLCLKYNVYPRIDYSREELTLRGDRESCFQCFFNLRQDKKVYQYIWTSKENDQKLINTFLSLKIDEAFALGESNIGIKDDDQMSFNIDLNKCQVRINKDKESSLIIRKELNDKKISIPSSWSSSFLTIRTVEIEKSSWKSFECFQSFEETMSTTDWQIERIDSIENAPLYIHFVTRNKKEKSQFYYHGCCYSSVQSIIHYGLHSSNASNYGEQYDPSSICLTHDILNSHLYGTRRSTDGKHYIFAVQIAKSDFNNDIICLSNEEIYLTLPTYLIVYQRRKDF